MYVNVTRTIDSYVMTNIQWFNKDDKCLPYIAIIIQQIRAMSYRVRTRVLSNIHIHNKNFA